MPKLISVFALWLLILSYSLTALAAPRYVMEDLGEPVRLPVPIEFVTRDSNGRSIAWGNIHSVSWDNTAYSYAGLIGVRSDTGEVITIDLKPYERGAKARAIKGDENTIYIFTGKPARFLKYDIAKNQLIQIGELSRAEFWMDHAVAPDGKIYLGTYPNTGVSVLDPKTETVEHWPKLSSDERQKYVTIPIVGEDGTMYFPVGQHHPELWSYNPRTKEKQQILPTAMMEQSGAPIVWNGEDGQVYGRVGQEEFLCKPDGIEAGKTAKARTAILDNLIGDKKATEIDAKSNLVLQGNAANDKTLIATQFKVPGTTVYSIGDVLNGKLYGGTAFPANSFSLDLKTGELEDLGRVSWARIQVYDTLAHGNGLFLSSYVGASLDYYDPQTRKRHPIVQLSKEYGQERVHQMEVGPDGMVYAGTIPVKGRLGGVLVRINPQDYSYKVWPGLVHNQSLTSVASVPQTSEVFVTTSIGGGTSAIPTEKEASVFLWNAAQEKISFQAQPIPGATSYGKAVTARTGIIYGFGEGTTYYAFDPVQRKTVFTGKLPVSGAIPTKRPPLLCDAPVGPQGLIYGIDRDAGNIIAIDPQNHSAHIVTNDPSLRGVIAVNATPDGMLYFGAAGHLMRVNLLPEPETN